MRLTKADTTALWHAVDNMAYMVRALPEIEGITREKIEAEREKLRAARIALQKIYKIMKESP